ncbi:hypothetical protein [Vallitalea guaymasensis]|uniref:hypothetical protein n=1 Tax=Vallitalea guaymasensis TaxID=1185412 RepID=UPI0023556B51|nr:hypothetical protein [Vallitalea guaymasensis]
MFNVVAINDSYSICIDAGWKDVKVGEKLLVLGDTGNIIYSNERPLGKHYNVKTKVVVTAVFRDYCICEAQKGYRLGTLPFIVNPNELSETKSEIKINDIIYKKPRHVGKHNEIPLEQTVNSNKALVISCLEELTTTSFLVKVSIGIGLISLILALISCLFL